LDRNPIDFVSDLFDLFDLFDWLRGRVPSPFLGDSGDYIKVSKVSCFDEAIYLRQAPACSVGLVCTGWFDHFV
jgi:hypothetical protein